MPSLNFFARFLSPAFSTFASRVFLFVEKITNKKLTGCAKLAKELKPSRITKTLAKKFFLPTPSWQVLCFATVLYSIDSLAQEGGLSGMRQGEQQRIQQQNRQVMQQFGSTPPPTQQEINADIQRQLNGKPPELTHQEKLKSQVVAILNEVHSSENSRHFNMNYYKSPEFASQTKSYTDALQNLKEQLEGKRKLSVSDAYFVMENAYGNSYLSKKEYDQTIKQSVDFIKKWLIQNGHSLKDNAALNMGIQKFMSDTLAIILANPDNPNQAKKVTHLPFFYDYEDFKGEKDFRNYFLTKCLATGSGQCNSMPSVYSSLADGLGAKSYLTFAPHHSFIKYFDNNGKLHSYEPTSNWKITDKWYQDNMFISPKAKMSGIYLDTLNKKQIVANCIIDLALGYLQKHGAADGTFVKECINTAMQQFPKQNNIQAYFVYSNLLARQLERVLYENKITDLNDISKVPEAQQLYNALLQNEDTITKLGYQDQPDPLYDELMKQQEFKGKLQQEHNITGKQKRNLFIKSF